jgi:putative protease
MGSATIKKPELLAPAGNLEKLKFAIHYGADAVYIGGQKYGLRSNADNFSFEEMEEAVRFARKYGAKIFVTTNIYAHHEDLDGLEEYLSTLQDIGISAFITADPVVILAAKRAAPKVEVHLSTQHSTMNYKAARFWKEEGIPRIVLARETSFEDIELIKRNVDIEIETFIHGAMCSSISGRCVLSNHFTDRDSNRGGCSQSCRWKYDLYMKDKRYPMFSPDDDAFTMSSKDLSMIEHIPRLIEIGVDSFKIEGRMKSIHYVASVVSAYRQAIDAYLSDPEGYQLKEEWVEQIEKAATRPLGSGFYFAPPESTGHIYGSEDHSPGYDFAGLVLDYDDSTKIAKIQQRNHFRPGQTVEFFGPDGRSFTQTVGTLWDEQGQEIDAARHPLQIVQFRVNRPVRKWDMMRKQI